MICLFHVTVSVSLTAKRATISLNKVKSGNALLHMLLVCIHSYIKSVLIYKFLILDTYNLTLYLHVQGCKDPSLFFEAKRNSQAKVWETLP